VLKGKWRLDEVIGVGGMAAVFAATHRNGSRVAIKVLNPEYAAQPEFVARFMREGYVANKINHPSSVLVLDDDVDEGCAFLVMELLTGYSLERYTRRGGRRLRVGQILHVTDKVLDLLAVAHGHGILHRDIKPANIHITAEGAVKVLDFGIARLAEPLGDAAATQTGAALGTPSYMPPEQARGRWNQIDPRTDLWALGATVHALLLGERPRRADTVQEEMLLAMTEPLRSLRETVPTTPVPVIEFVERATAFEMEGRFADARTMQAALRQVAVAVGASPAGAATEGTIPAPSIPPPSMPALGADPGSMSGPRVDTAGMVAPRAADRDPMTLNATAQTANPVVPRARSRRALVAGVLAGVVAVALGLGARHALVAPVAADSFEQGSAGAPVAATRVVPPAPPSAPAPAPPPPAAPSPPSPAPPAASPPPAADAIVELDPAPPPSRPPATATPATPPPAIAVTPPEPARPVAEPKAPPAPEKRRPKPAKPSAFDEQF
jgi:serine/threonine-protein kinase